MSAQPSLFSPKVVGMTLAAEKRPSMLEMARRAANYLASKHGEVAADDVQFELLRSGINTAEMLKNAAGSIFNDGSWVRTGFRQSKWEPSHGRIISVWRKK